MIVIRLIILFLYLFSSTAIGQAPGVPPERLALLARGVNLSHWLWLPGGREGQARRDFISGADLKELHVLGLTHVRLPFEPGDLWDFGAHALKPAGVAELTWALEQCLAAELAVIVDAHPTGASPWAALDPKGDSAELERFWSALAAALSATDPDRVFLEILNEPHDIKDPAAWPAAQQRLATAIRAAAPRHTIIATGDEWGSVAGLTRLTPLADPNVVYSFHFYEPHNFTHQGATWGYAPWRHMEGLPYPSTAESIAPIADAIQDEQARNAVRWYSKEPWNADRLRTLIEPAAAWSRKHRVPVYCGEFGVFAQSAPRESRLAWLRDTAAALRASRIGHAMWDYTGGFALAPGPPGHRSIDPQVGAALCPGSPATR